MRDDDPEWDDEKAATNLARHGVSFNDARKVFDDPLMIDKVDDRFRYDEQRGFAVGLSDGRLIAVSYTDRNDRIRIISARGAEPAEQRAYHET